MRRSEYDREWADELFRRWERRRYWRQRKASAALDAAGTELLDAVVMPVVRLVERVPFLRWLVR